MTNDGDLTIFHNPACSNSRQALALIRHAGLVPTIVEYLKTPPAKDALRTLFAATGEPIRALLREKEAAYADLHLGDPAKTDDELLDAVVQHPVLMNRPLVVSPRGTRLCRPPEAVLVLLPEALVPPYTKENGELVQDDGQRWPVR